MRSGWECINSTSVERFQSSSTQAIHLQRGTLPIILLLLWCHQPNACVRHHRPVPPTRNFIGYKYVCTSTSWYRIQGCWHQRSDYTGILISDGHELKEQFGPTIIEVCKRRTQSLLSTNTPKIGFNILLHAADLRRICPDMPLITPLLECLDYVPFKTNKMHALTRANRLLSMKLANRSLYIQVDYATYTITYMDGFLSNQPPWILHINAYE